MRLRELFVGGERHRDSVAARDQFPVGESLPGQPSERRGDRRKLRLQPGPSIRIGFDLAAELRQPLGLFAERFGRRRRLARHRGGQLRRTHVAIDELRDQPAEPQHQLQIPLANVHHLR